MNADLWVISMTLQGWTRNEILDLPDDERWFWAEECRRHQEALNRAAKGKR